MLKNKKKRFNIINNIKTNTADLTRKEKFIIIAKLMAFLFIIIGLPLIIIIFYRDIFFNTKSLRHLLTSFSNNKFEAFIVLILTQITQIIISIIPGQPIQIAASYTFGFWGGLLITLTGAILGTIVTYMLASFLGRSAMRIIFGKDKINEYSKKLNNRKSYLIIFILYLIPGIPKDSVSYIAGISEIKLRPFIYLSTLGRIPGVAGSLLLGYFSKTHNYEGLAIVSVIAILIFGVSIYRRKEIAEWIDSVEEKGDRMEELDREYRLKIKNINKERREKKRKIEIDIENKNRKIDMNDKKE